MRRGERHAAGQSHRPGDQPPIRASDQILPGVSRGGGAARHGALVETVSVDGSVIHGQSNC
jgi:hypothetical protein